MYETRAALNCTLQYDMMQYSIILYDIVKRIVNCTRLKNRYIPRTTIKKIYCKEHTFCHQVSKVVVIVSGIAYDLANFETYNFRMYSLRWSVNNEAYAIHNKCAINEVFSPL